MDDMRWFNVAPYLLEKCRAVILDQREFDPEVFPIKVFQYATKGPLHNLSPMNHQQERPDGKLESFFRIFANGLFFHITDTTNFPPFDLG